MHYFKQKKKLLLLALVLFLYGLVLLPLLVINLQKQQNLKGKAAEISTSAICANSPSDIELIIDKSGSMNDNIGTTTKLASAKVAANSFMDIIAQNANNKVGLVTFSTTATQNSGLTNNFSSVKSQITNISASADTCTECGVKTANQEIAANGRAGMKKVVILLTDGKANVVSGNSNQVNTSVAEQKTLAAVTSGHTASETIFYTIGLGNDVNQSFLQNIATSTGGKYFFSPTNDQLTAIYTEISQIIGKGTISGTIFNDANGNGVLDQGEQPLSGWTVQLGGTNSQTVTTDASGNYTFTGLCNGNYTIKETLQTGWKQTLPTNVNGYTVTLNNNSLADQRFGNKKVTRCSDEIDNDNNGFIDSKDSTCHTDGNPGNPNSYDPNIDGEHGSGQCSDSKDNNGNGVIDGADPVCHTDKNPNNPGTYVPTLPENGNTCVDGKENNGNGLIDSKDPVCHTDGNPGNPNSYDPNLPEKNINTSLSLTVLQHGIGASGDNTNAANSLSNKTPKHSSVSAEVQIFNSANQLVTSASGMLSYNTTNGNYTGIVELGQQIATSGAFTITVKTAHHLRRLMDGIRTITVGQENSTPVVSLVTGDIIQDNALNILDYNSLLDCYSDLAAPTNCSDATKKANSDINDDAAVNQIDYNLFLREISTQPGQ